jgi:TDG/mug DNA glycosylase family protein
VHKLPDVLAPNLRVVFVGTAAGRRSAELGAYYAGRGNRFWRTLHEVGITPRLYEPQEFPSLLALGIGLTDTSKLGAGMDYQIKREQYDASLFETNMRRYRPRTIAFTSKRAAGVWLRASSTRGIMFGRQAKRTADFTEVFVMPSPSGAARATWSIGPWQKLANWLTASATR